MFQMLYYVLSTPPLLIHLTSQPSRGVGLLIFHPLHRRENLCRDNTTKVAQPSTQPDQG